MKDILYSGSLKAKLICEVETSRGYMQVLEYVLQDSNFLHVINWYFNEVLEDNKLTPKVNSTSFYCDKLGTLEFADRVGCELLKCI